MNTGLPGSTATASTSTTTAIPKSTKSRTIRPDDPNGLQVTTLTQLINLCQSKVKNLNAQQLWNNVVSALELFEGQAFLKANVTIISIDYGIMTKLGQLKIPFLFNYRTIFSGGSVTGCFINPYEWVTAYSKKIKISPAVAAIIPNIFGDYSMKINNINFTQSKIIGLL